MLLHLLGLPAGTLRALGIATLALLGLALLVPRVERLLERPFALIPQVRVGNTGAGSGFALGLALGAVYVPCAGPVLAAIAIAGAGQAFGWPTVALTVGFAAGTAVPLLVIGSEMMFPPADSSRHLLHHYGFSHARSLSFKRIAKAGHYVMLEQPVMTASVLLAFGVTADYQFDQ